MLSERELQLLTACVDGVLSARQQKAAARLLHKSEEARHVLHELQEQARLIQQLPQRKLDGGFTGRVMAAIQSQPRVANSKPQLRVRHWPAWTRYAVAASVLAILVGGVAWLTSRQPQIQPEQLNIAKKNIPESAPHIDHGPLAAKIATGTFSAFANQPVLPDRNGPKVSFDDLAKTQWQELFVVEMGRQKAVHLDITASNQRQATQRIETVLQNKGVRVERDARVTAIMNQTEQQSPTEFVIYAENIRADELAAMLFELGTDERARTSIEALTVSNVTDDDQKRLGKIFGIDAEELRDPAVAPKLPLKKFIPKEEQKPATGPDQGPVRSASAGVTRLAMVLANESQNGKVSSQIQYFINQRRQLQPGTLQVLVVVHRV